MSNYRLAQVNVALARDEMESAVMEGFVSRLAQINALADRSPGFVWRLQAEAGDPTSLRVFDDPLLLVNLSVWESLETLRQFVYKSLHVELIRDRDAWFTKTQAAHQALWWIPDGHTPSLAEAKARLEHIRSFGPTREAFTFARSFPAMV
jgi:hypothetical protein